jgi:hypothetical protein
MNRSGRAQVYPDCPDCALALANSDPIAVTIRSGFNLSFILDCISEALAWCYLGKNGIAVTQLYALPGALEIAGLVDELDYQDDAGQDHLRDKQLADETLVAVAEKLKMKKEDVERIFRTIWDDSRVDFLSKLMEAIEGVRQAAGLN